MEIHKRLIRVIVISAILISSLFVVASADTGLIMANDGLNMRSGAGTNYSIICAIPKGTIVDIIGYENGWLNVTYNGKQGFVLMSYVTIRNDLANRSGQNINRDLSAGQRVVEYAKQFIGTPYKYGGSSPSGFDCSGFTSYVYKHFGYSINRVAADQARNGVAVDRSNLQPGDLLLFKNGGSGIGHAGIYVGNGQMIHSVKPGVSVRIQSITSGYYYDNFVCARRIVG